MTFHGLFDYDDPATFDQWYAQQDKKAWKDSEFNSLDMYYGTTIEHLAYHIASEHPKGTPEYERLRKLYFARAQRMIDDGARPSQAHMVVSCCGDSAHDTSLVLAMYHADDELLQFLLDNGANPNLRHRGRRVDGKYVGGANALHVAAGYDWFFHERGGWRGSKEYYRLLLRHGGKDTKRGEGGLTPREIYVQNFIADSRPPKPESGFSPEQLIALAAGAALTGASSLSSAQKMDFAAAYTKDVLSDSGGTHMQQWQASEAAKLDAASGGGGRGTSAPAKEASFTFKCPMGRSENTVEIPYYTERCLSAAKDFTKAYACNLVDEMESAKSACVSACGDPTCMERAKGS